MQTPDDLRLMAERAAADALLARDFGQTDAAVDSVWNALILFGAADEIERRRGRGPTIMEAIDQSSADRPGPVAA